MKAVHSNLSEEQLVLGIGNGDRSAIQKLYKDYYPRIRKFIESNSGTSDDAMDMFQEAVMVLHRKLKSADFNLTSSLYTFLYAVTRNLWLKELKKRKQKGVTSDLENVSIGTEEIEGAIHLRDKYKLFRDKMKELGEGCQQILRLFFEGKSMNEISEIMDISEKYARKRKFQCKEKLIESIKKDPLYDELKTS